MPLPEDAQAAAQVSEAFTRWLLIGMGTAIVAMATFIAFLVRKLISVCVSYAAAVTVSNEAVKESTEVIRSLTAAGRRQLP